MLNIKRKPIKCDEAHKHEVEKKRRSNVYFRNKTQDLRKFKLLLPADR